MSEDIKAEVAALVPRLRRFAYAISGSREEGDDLVQTACVKALSRLQQFEPGSRLDSWMFRIVQTSHLDAMRQRRRWGSQVSADHVERLSDGGRGANQAEDRMLLGRLRREMAALPSEQRVVLALVGIEGCSYKEAAKILDIPIGTVMSRLARARARLFPLIEEAS